MSWASATSPVSSTTGPSPRRRRRTLRRPCRRSRSRRGLTARAAARARTAGERLDVADRHRGGDEQGGVRRRATRPAAARPRARTARRRAGRRSPAPPAASAARHASSQPGSTSSCPPVCGSALRMRIPTTLSGSCHVRRGSNAIWAASRAGASHARSGLEVGRSPTRKHETRPVRVRELRDRAAAGRSGRSPRLPARAPTVGRRAPGSRRAPRTRRGRPGPASGAGDDQHRPEGWGPGPPSPDRICAGSTITYGRPPARAGDVVGQRAVEHERLAEREVEVHRARPLARARSRTPGRPASGSTAAARASRRGRRPRRTI